MMEYEELLRARAYVEALAEGRDPESGETLSLADARCAECLSFVSDVLSQDYDIATRPGAHCAPRMHEALGTTELGAVRFSFSWFNTEEEVDAAIAAVREISQ